jgi:hypothetical protein
LRRNSSHSTTHRTQAKPSSWAARLADQLHQAGTSASGQPLIRPEPHPGQRLFLDCDHPRRLLVAHRRFGKDWATVLDILRRIEGWRQEPHRHRLEPPIHIGVIYPTYELVDDFWGALKRMTPRSEVADCWNGKPQRLTLKCGAVIAVRTASDPDLLVSRGYDLLVLGEAARMSRDAWLTALPALASPGRAGLVVHQTTPLGRNWIAAEAEDSSWWRMVVPIWQPGSRERHPLANPHILQEAILEEERQLPERWFRQEWMVEFLGGEGTVFRNPRERIAPAPAQPKQPVIVGVDLAKRADFSVFVAFDGAGRMLGMERVQERPYPDQARMLMDFVQRWPVSRVVIELNGPGEAFCDLFNEMLRDNRLSHNVEGIYTTTKSKDEMVSALVVAFEAGRITILDEPVLVSEFEVYTAKRLESGRDRYGAPEGYHDDCVLACALAWSRVPAGTRVAVPTMPGPNDARRLQKRSVVRGLGENPRTWYQPRWRP